MVRKHANHGGNVQVVSVPDGWPIWTSEVRPGREHDTTAVRITARSCAPSPNAAVGGRLRGMRGGPDGRLQRPATAVTARRGCRTRGGAAGAARVASTQLPGRER